MGTFFILCLLFGILTFKIYNKLKIIIGLLQITHFRKKIILNDNVNFKAITLFHWVSEPLSKQASSMKHR